MSIVCKISSRVFTLKVFVSTWVKLMTGCSKNITKAINLQSVHDGHTTALHGTTLEIIEQYTTADEMFLQKVLRFS